MTGGSGPQKRNEPHPRAVIYGCAGPVLTPGEAWFFERARPWGFILFQRNCQSRAQVRALVEDLRATVGRPDAPVLIDQEGGRVARLKPPEWQALPAAGKIGALHRQNGELAREALSLHSRLLAHELASLGVTVDCVPVADVPAPDSHGIIGDRAYGDSVDIVVDMARLCADELMADGVLPVLKHMPGHGRARVDSHEELPVVDASRAELERVDFEAFRALNDLPLGMTAHVVYSDIDPAAPATWSAKVIGEIIRGHIGFDGLLMTDDLSMHALKGPFHERVSRALGAGCDVILHCNGHMDEMTEIASAAPPLSGEPARRAEAALAKIRHAKPRPFDVAAGHARLAVILDEGAA
ncbi:MAG: beta-N-acetylhexosaminidase [Alphaproteobacteria bacterium]